MPLRSLIIVVGGTLLASLPPLTTALAQEISKAREGNAWIGFVVAAVLALLVAVVSFMGSKRTHQDT